MMGTTVQDQVNEVSRLMAERLGVRGATLEVQVRRAGRLLPRARAREARYLAQAATLIQNPKLARMIDARQAASAHAALVQFLTAIDPKERRKDRILGVLGILAANVLLIGGGVITWLWWRGIV